jgi:hypothetical protein
LHSAWEEKNGIQLTKQESAWWKEIMGLDWEIEIPIEIGMEDWKVGRLEGFKDTILISK